MCTDKLYTMHYDVGLSYHMCNRANKGTIHRDIYIFIFNNIYIYICKQHSLKRAYDYIVLYIVL